MGDSDAPALGSGCGFDRQPSSLVNYLKMFAVEVHELHATIASLEKRASSMNCGFQHILKKISSGESEDLSAEVDNFWNFFSCDPTVLRKWNDIVQANTPKEVMPRSSDICGTDLEVDDDTSQLDFCESFALTWTSDEVGGIFAEQLAFVDPALGVASQSQLDPGEGSAATPVKESKEDMHHVASGPAKIIYVGMSKLDGLTGGVLHFLDPQKDKIQNLGSLVWQAARDPQKDRIQSLGSFVWQAARLVGKKKD